MSRTIATRIGIVLLICLCGGELVSRAYLCTQYGGSPEAAYTQFGHRRTPRAGFELQSHQSTTYLEGLHTIYATNSEGFRGTDEYAEKIDDELRVALIGGSVIFGQSATRDDTSPGPALTQALQERFTNRRVSVINAGNPGHVSHQVFTRLVMRVLRYEPEVVVVHTGWHDLYTAPDAPAHDPYYFLHKEHYFSMQEWQSVIREQNTRITSTTWLQPWAITTTIYAGWDRLRHWRTPRAPQLVTANTDAFLADAATRARMLERYRDNMRQIASVLVYRDITPVFVTLFSEYDIHAMDRAEMNAVIREVAEESGGWLIDADYIVRMTAPTGINNPEDRYHLTDEGSSFLAELIADRVVARETMEHLRASEQELWGMLRK